ncbi:MAG: phoB [Labilithrix sp.]|nr:phoB [Labilithrix sp.]
MTNAVTVHKKRVLVVEDDPDAREIYESTLRHAGYDVTPAGSIASALGAVGTRRPDIVVLDCRLPDGHGLDLLRRWKRSATMRDVPIVVITAYSAHADVEAAAFAGADAFIVKPCSGEALTSYLSRVLIASAPTRRLPRHYMTRRMAPLAVVYPSSSEGRATPSFNEHDDGNLQARCSRCLRSTPLLGRRANEAAKRAIALGWSTQAAGWWCPVCVDRTRTRDRA